MILDKRAFSISTLSMVFKLIVNFTIVFLFVGQNINAQFVSDIIFNNADGTLTYISDANGNRIPDYSHAGYRGGGVPLPEVPVEIRISPVSGDNSEHIQNAIDRVSALPLKENGFRGAILLNPGIYTIGNNLQINASGVVLRGSGDGTNSSQNSIIRVTNNVRGTVLQIGNDRVNWIQPKGESFNIITEFVTVGSRVFEIEDATSFDVGDNIIIRHRSTQRWLDAVDGGGTGIGEPWQPGFIDIFYNRYITNISGNIIQIDTPVYNHLDKSLSESFVYKPDRTHLISETGVENLRIEIQTSGQFTESHAENGIIFRGVENGWAKNVTVLHFQMTGIGTHTSTFVTIKNSNALQPHSQITGSRRYNFHAMVFSNNILFTKVTSSQGRREFIVNGISSASGIVFHESISIRALGASEGHQKWSQAILYDNISFENPEHNNVLSLYNRGNLGSSHGWSAVHSTAWNIQAENRHVFIQKPPTAQNYGIGNQANVSGIGIFPHPPGYIEGSNQTPEFPSLYTKQLEERLLYGVPPDMPHRFNVSNSIRNQIDLNWDYLSTGESSIIIERSKDNGSFEQIATLNQTARSYTDNTVLDHDYRYRIFAIKNGRKSARAVSNKITPRFTNDIISDFRIIQPENRSNIILEGEPDQILQFMWTEAESRLDLTYRVLIDYGNGTFSNPVIFRDSLSETNISIMYSELDRFLHELGIKNGENTNLYWRVIASSRNMAKHSDNSIRLQLTRNDLDYVTAFSLISPSKNININVSGLPDDSIEFIWEQAQSIEDFTYTWYLDLIGSNFSDPLLSIDLLTDNQITITYEQLDALLSGAGIKYAEILEAKWAVKAITDISQKWSTTEHPINLKRGVIVEISDFSLNKPSKNAEFNITGLSENTIDFSWEEAESSHNFTYSLYIDYNDKDFSEPLVQIDSIPENHIRITYEQLDSLVNAAGINNPENLDAKWAIKVKTDYAQKWSTTEHPINLNMGVVVKISDFSLLNPTVDEKFEITGLSEHTIDFYWEDVQSSHDFTYSLYLDFIDEDFSTPLLIIESITMNQSGITFEQLDLIMNSAGINHSEYLEAKWSVKVNTDYAEKWSTLVHPIHFKRGDIVAISDFSLISPSMHQEFNISGLSENTIDFIWEEVLSSHEFTYSWYLDFVDEDFSDPLFRIDSITENQISLSFEQLELIMSSAGIEYSELLESKWSVKVNTDVAHKWSNSEHPINLKMGIVVEISDFGLRDPANNEMIELIGSSEQEVQFSWQRAASNIDFNYTLLIDKQDGNFTDPLIRIESIMQENFGLTYQQIYNILVENNVETNDFLDVKWTIEVYTDHATKKSIHTNNISFIRGTLFEGFVQLEQNYPNPFSHSTTIVYHLAGESPIRFRIFNINGVLVADIDKGMKTRGTHHLRFDGAALSSGVYFYRVQTGESVDVGKMTLIK